MIMKRIDNDDRRSVFAIDWLEYRGCIDWTDSQINRWIPKLEAAKRMATDLNGFVPFRVGNPSIDL